MNKARTHQTYDGKPVPDPHRRICRHGRYPLKDHPKPPADPETEREVSGTAIPAVTSSPETPS